MRPMLTWLCMAMAKLVEDVDSVEASVLAQLTRDDLQCAGKRCNKHLLLASNGARVLSKVLRDLHLDGTTAGDDGVIAQRSSDDHDGVVERSFRLFDELLSTTAKNDCARPGLGATGEDVVSEKRRGKNKKKLEKYEMSQA